MGMRGRGPADLREAGPSCRRRGTPAEGETSEPEVAGYDVDTPPGYEGRGHGRGNGLHGKHGGGKGGHRGEKGEHRGEKGERGAWWW